MKGSDIASTITSIMSISSFIWFDVVEQYILPDY
uniref:Uncharacterized protein n=1 Tax=Aegilops tauschii subsp. strangulata TaxID=200361 RepID=A0A452Y3R6_AEGTS